MQRSLPATHPCLPGHFPGQPVVPGVMILEWVADAAREWRGAGPRLTGLPSVKFMSPLLPEELLEIHLDDDGGVLKFRCLVGDRWVAQGVLELA